MDTLKVLGISKICLRNEKQRRITKQRIKEGRNSALSGNKCYYLDNNIFLEKS